jgi:SAM-dependent methyltransferase
MERKHAFDQVVSDYAAARPGYPPVMADDIAAIAQLPSPSRILEIGCGTGQSTELFARKGHRLIAVELGANLAAYVRERFADDPGFSVVNAAFEDYSGEIGFDLVFSASAFHWIDPAVGFPLIHSLLNEHGSLALCWNHRQDRELDTPVFHDIHNIYHEMFPEPTTTRTTIAERIRQAADCGLFGEPVERMYPYELTYTTDQYLQLLSTYSDHILMEAERRGELFTRLRKVVDGYGGRLTLPYQAQVQVLRRR